MTPEASVLAYRSGRECTLRGLRASARPLIEPLDDPNHSPEELDEYESLLVENGGAQVMYEAVANFGDDAYADAQAHPYGGGAPVREPDPACVASCEDNCTYLQYDQIGICQYSCPDACR